MAASSANHSQTLQYPRTAHYATSLTRLAEPKGNLSGLSTLLMKATETKLFQNPEQALLACANQGHQSNSVALPNRLTPETIQKSNGKETLGKRTPYSHFDLHHFRFPFATFPNQNVI